MPTRPGKQCNKMGCAGIAYGQSHCETHAKTSKGWAVGQQGKTTTDRGYGHAWRKTRKQIIRRDNGLCQEHFRLGKFVAGNTVDHIINKGSGGTDEHDNLETLCDDCHKAKTQRESRLGWGRGG